MNVNGMIDKAFGNNNHRKQKRTNPNIINIENKADDNFYLNILQTIKQEDINQPHLGPRNGSKREPTPKRTHFNPSFIKDQPDCCPSPSVKTQKYDHDKASKTSHLRPRKLQKEKNVTTPIGNILMMQGLSLNKESSIPNPISNKRKSACSNLRYLSQQEGEELTPKQNEKELGTNLSNCNIESCRSRKAIQFCVSNQGGAMTKPSDEKEYKRLEIKVNIQFEVFSDQNIPQFPEDILQIEKINSFEGYKMTKKEELLVLLNEGSPQNKIKGPLKESHNNNNNIIIINQNGFNAYEDNQLAKRNNKKKRMMFCCIPVK